MNWIWWLAIGLLVGFYFGVALMVLLQLSSRRERKKALWASMIAGAPLEGPSTIF